jgi:hypothetical protein
MACGCGRESAHRRGLRRRSRNRWLDLRPVADVDASPSPEWHRWVGACATLAAAGAALAAHLVLPSVHRSPRSVWVYRATLGSAAALVGVTGHLGSVLVWDTHFFRL